MHTGKNGLVAFIALLFSGPLMVFNSSIEAEESPDYQALAALNQQYLESYRNGNIAFFDRILADEFREVSPDGTTLNKAQFLEKIAARATNTARLTISASDLEIRIFDDTAIVNAIPTITAPNGAVTKGGRYTDAYVRRGNEWICLTAHLGGI